MEQDLERILAQYEHDYETHRDYRCLHLYDDGYCIKIDGNCPHFPDTAEIEECPDWQDGEMMPEEDEL